MIATKYKKPLRIGSRYVCAPDLVRPTDGLMAKQIGHVRAADAARWSSALKIGAKPSLIRRRNDGAQHTSRAAQMRAICREPYQGVSRTLVDGRINRSVSSFSAVG